MNPKPFELIIRKTEFPGNEELETELDIYDPNCRYLYASTPKITDIPMIEKSAYTKAIDTLKGISLETELIDSMEYPTNVAEKAKETLKELGEI